MIRAKPLYPVVPSDGDDVLSATLGLQVYAFDLGAGNDRVILDAPPPATQIRVTFTSAEVGNTNPKDANTLAGQDGGLAVRLQVEDAMGQTIGAVSRLDDEGIRFEARRGGLTFDVRDLVSGAQRGDAFGVVALGTSGADMIDESAGRRAIYVNAGMGDDMVIGSRQNDFLVGGAGADMLSGGRGNDSFIGGGGDDSILGGDGADFAIVNLATDGRDAINLGDGLDTVNVSAPGSTQLRVTFTSAEVGNARATDAGMLANQDGGLAVRLMVEDADGMATGTAVRLDDEGLRLVSTTPGVTFDVRDLVSGAARGDMFAFVQLGTDRSDRINESATTGAVYVNAGQGNDQVTGSAANDFLVGGLGNDRISGGLGDDSLLGGAGRDTFLFRADEGQDRIIGFETRVDRIDLTALDIGRADLILTTSGADTIVTADADGDGAADLSITLLGVTMVSSRDFLL